MSRLNDHRKRYSKSNDYLLLISKLTVFGYCFSNRFFFLQIRIKHRHQMKFHSTKKKNQSHFVHRQIYCEKMIPFRSISNTQLIKHDQLGERFHQFNI